MQFLYDSQEIRNKIKEIFSDEDEKYAIVAFLGDRVHKILENNTNNLKVICWPKAGSTSSNGIRELINLGVEVYFCDNLHHKIYWSKKNGVVLGSANLSSRALINGDQHESAIFYNGDNFDLNKLLAKLKIREVTSEELYELDVLNETIKRSNNLPEKPSKDKNKDMPSFLDALKMRFPRKWKIITWSRERSKKEEEIIHDEVQEEFNVRRHENSNDIENKNFRAGDYVLQIKTDEDGEILAPSGRWLVIDKVIWRRDLHAIVQVKKNMHLSPPFLIDAALRKALRDVINDSDWDDIYDANNNPTKEFIDKLSKTYRDN